MRVLILGCGYLGLPLGAELVRNGHEVIGVRRSGDGADALRVAGVQPRTADVTNPQQLASLPSGYDWVVNCVSSERGGVEEYRKTYLEGTHNVIAWLERTPPRKYVHVGSTSVYGQTDGSWVKESSPTEPACDTSRVLVETEQELMKVFRERGFPAIVVRVAGIYGPGRGHLFLKYLNNEVRVSGKGQRMLNMIHLEDLVGSLVAVLKSGRAGEIYNLVDDEPVAEIHFFRWLSETLGKWMPPFAGEEDAVLRKRGRTSKRVQNRRLKMELGYQFKYPTFRQGYTAEIRRLDDAGELNIELEPR